VRVSASGSLPNNSVLRAANKSRVIYYDYAAAIRGRPIIFVKSKKLTLFGLCCVLLVLAAVVTRAFYLRKQLSKSRQNWCLSDRMLVDGAKMQYAMQSRATNGTRVSAEDILPFLPPFWTTDMLTRGTCLDKGIFTLGLIGEEPKCSVHGGIVNEQSHRPFSIW
jgi:hypothetical protein